MTVASIQTLTEAHHMEEPVSPVAFALLVQRVEQLERNYYEIKTAMGRIEDKLGKVVLFVALLAGGAGAGASQLVKMLMGG